VSKKIIPLFFFVCIFLDCFSSHNLPNTPESPMTPTCLPHLFDLDSALSSPRRLHTSPRSSSLANVYTEIEIEEEEKSIRPITPHLATPINPINLILDTPRTSMRNLARTSFPANFPGLEPLLNTDTTGAAFELESALYAQKELEEIILGFGLKIKIKEEGIELDNGQEIRTTEYDIVTLNYVIESKSSEHPGRHAGINQFKKEQNMLIWLQIILKEIINNTLTYGITYDPDIEKNPFFTVYGTATNFQEVSLTCNWIPYLNDEQFIYSWIQLIKSLSQKTLLIFFKYKANTHLKARLEDFIFFDEVTHGTFLNANNNTCKTFELDEAISPRLHRVATPINDIRNLLID
jgi:hypothetical protein